MVAIIPSFMMLTLNMAIVAVFWFGGRNVIQGSMQVGQFLAFVNYLPPHPVFFNDGQHVGDPNLARRGIRRTYSGSD
jgi:hypothetical protein